MFGMVSKAGGACTCFLNHSAAELKKAAAYYARAAVLHPALTGKAELAANADLCRSRAEAM